MLLHSLKQASLPGREIVRIGWGDLSRMKQMPDLDAAEFQGTRDQPVSMTFFEIRLSAHDGDFLFSSQFDQLIKACVERPGFDDQIIIDAAVFAMQ